MPSLRLLFANWRARQKLKKLLDAEDRLLDDIGITRQDLEWALRLSLTVNPALELNRQARKRHDTMVRLPRRGRRRVNHAVIAD